MLKKNPVSKRCGLPLGGDNALCSFIFVGKMVEEKYSNENINYL